MSVKVPGLAEFLKSYDGMDIKPGPAAELRLTGTFEFNATHPKHPSVHDRFELEIAVPAKFPKELPDVIETGGRIPRSDKFHVNPDGSLCLGSPLSLMIKLSERPTLDGFAISCLMPYLFAVSRKLTTGEDFIFGQLDHGAPGLYDDYMRLLALNSPAAVRDVFRLLGMPRQLANKKPCPCGCGRRLGRCSYNNRLHEFRRVASQEWFRSQSCHFR